MEKSVRSICSVVLALFLLSLASTRAATIVWTNTAGGNWSTAANWSPNQVPGASDTALITNAGTYAVTISAATTVSDLTLGASNVGVRTLLIPSGTLTVTNTIARSNGVIGITGGTLLTAGNFSSAGTVYETGGSWRLLATGTLDTHNFTNGELRGATLTVTNFNWVGGNIYADAPGDKTIIPAGGTLNLLTDATRYLSYYAGGVGRGLDNFGAWSWSGNSILFAYPTAVNNHGTLNITGQGAPNTYAQFSYVNGAAAPTFNNFGTITKSVGTNIFYFGSCIINNSGTLAAQSGTFTLYYSIVTNTGAINIQNALLQSTASTVQNSGPITLDSNSLFQTDTGGEFTFRPGSSLASPGINSVRVNSGTVFVQTTNFVSPTVVINGGTLFHQTNNVVPTINQASGTWRLIGNQTVNTYNFTNGELRGGVLTATNVNWVNGNMNADANTDKTIIPAGGVLNFIGTATRYLSYVGAASRGRDLENRGTWNWTGDSVLYGVGAAVVNNLGSVEVTAPGVSYYSYYPGYTGPTWNNVGNFTKSNGTNAFYFQGAYVNNTGTLASQSGTLSVHSGVFNNHGPINIQNGLFQSYANTATNHAAITLSANSSFQTDAGGTFAFNPGSSIQSPGFNSIRLLGGTVILQTPNIVSPSIWISGATLWQHVNNAVPVINESSGVWRLTGNFAVNTFNFTNGELRGGTLTVTNLNWINGNMNADVNGDKTIIPPGGVFNFPGNATRQLSFHSSRGRDFDNYGTWNWSGDSVLYGVGAAVINNYGTVNASGAGDSYYSYYPGYAGPIWNNLGTFNKSAGNTFYFQGLYLNNSNQVNVSTGRLSLASSVVTNLPTGAITLGAGALLLNEASTTTLEPSSVITSSTADAFRITSGTVYARSTGLTLPSLWLSGGTLSQETNIVTTVNQSGGIWRPTLPVNATTYNLTNGEFRGANLTVDTFNWLGGQLNSDGPGSDLVTVNTTLNIQGNTAKTLSYYVQPGRSVINNGAASWGGVSITGQGGATLRNSGTLTITNDVALAWGGSGAGSVLHNTGTLTKKGGTGQSYFSSTTITNSGTFNFQAGTIRFASYVQTAGSGFLNTNFISDGALRIDGGSVTGGGSVAGALFNSGTLNPGTSPGLITGTTYTGAGGSALNVELGGTTGAGTNYDQLRLSAAATLAGALNVSLANGFAPALSNSFTVMTFPSRSGTFSAVLPPPGVTMETTYSSTNVVLTVTALTNVSLQISSFPSNQIVFQGDPATFSVGVSGVTPITYQWQFNSNNIAGATNNIFSIPAVALTNAGNYQVLIQDSVGATTNASATLAVVPFTGTIQWTNALGGNWSAVTNWNPNRVPGPTNTAAITLSGTYTVMINTAAAVSNLVVGGVTGTQTVYLASSQTLALGRDASFATNTAFSFDGVLQTAGGSNYFGGLVNWYSGVLSGAGRTVVDTTGGFHFISSLIAKYIATNIVENYGNFTASGDAGLGPGQFPQFSGGAHLTNHVTGTLHMGANGINYSGAQTLRSYFVNFGRVVAATTTPFSPTTIGIDLINYGTLDNYSYLYIFRGRNYGTMWGYNGLTEISIFGDPATGEYFSFEPGTTLTGVGPNIACGGPVQWKAGNTVHNGSLRISQGSGGATFANAEFKVLANYTNTVAVGITRGGLTITDPNIITDLRSYSDGFVSFWSFGVTNAGTMYVDNFSHVIYGFGNGGTLVIRTNGGFAGGSLYGDGHVIISPTATATFSGMSVDAQLIENFGSTVVSGATSLTGDTYFDNKSGRPIYFGGGDFRTGPASLANFGTINGFGGIYIPATNHNLVTADDPLERTLALGDYWQVAGETRLRGGNFGGLIRLLGGTLDGAGGVGSVINGASVLPGNPLGTISASGGYTNQSSGTYHLQIAATNNYDRVNVAGTAQLAGTLNVAFTNGFFPTIGSTFTAMTYTARSGTFDQILTPNYQFEVIYLANALLLRASNALPSVNLVVSSGNTQLVCTPFSLTATTSDLDGVVTNLAVFLNGNLLASSGGTPLNVNLESDFPGVAALTARATDDRSGVRWTTQNVQMVTLPLHVLTLGGIRTNGFKICMLGEAGANYFAYATTNLSHPFSGWTNLGLMERTNGIFRHFDAGTITNRSHRVYRALKQ